MRGPVNVDPLLHGAFQSADAMANVCIENLGSAARYGIEAGISQSGDRVPQGQAADLGDVHDFRRRKTVLPDIEATPDRAQQIFVPFDMEVRMQTALHQDPGAAQVDCLLDFLEDLFLGENVAFGMAHRAVERAEAAILSAK